MSAMLGHKTCENFYLRLCSRENTRMFMIKFGYYIVPSIIAFGLRASEKKGQKRFIQ